MKNAIVKLSNELMRLFLAQQQQRVVNNSIQHLRQQELEIGISATQKGDAMEGLNDLIANYLSNETNSSRIAKAANNASSTAQVLPAAAASNNMELQLKSSTKHQLLESAKLLANVNPGMAASAMQQALALGPTNPLPYMHQMQQQQVKNTYFNSIVQSTSCLMFFLLLRTLINQASHSTMFFIRGDGVSKQYVDY
jgi:hypothetical protein